MARSSLPYLFTCLASVLLAASAQNAAKCSSNADCTLAGCSCSSGSCIDLLLFGSNLERCTNCETNSTCISSGADRCMTSIGKCRDCAIQAVRPALAKCRPVSQPSPAPATSTSQPQPTTDSSISAVRCFSNVDCTVIGCLCSSGLCTDLLLLSSNVRKCPNCATNGQCATTAGDECLSTISKCNDCATRAAALAYSKCIPGSTPSSTPSMNPSIQPPPTNNSIGVKKCASNSDCVGAGCVCLTAHCTDFQLMVRNMARCPNCTSSAGCSSPGDRCLTVFDKCEGCVAKAAIPALQKCNGRAISTSPSPSAQPSTTNGGTGSGNSNNLTNASKVSRDGSCSSNDNCLKRCRCFTGQTASYCVSNSVLAGNCQSCANDEETTKCKQCVIQLGNTARRPCVCISTQFLMERGLGDAALRHFGVAHVLCIPGLPCGTPGHLLRECTSGTACRLVSYREVCQLRSDCATSSMRVSQLKHSIDWSQYHISSGSAGTTLSLTSLSADPDASPMAPSRLIAKVTDILNQAGLGFVTNGVARLSNSLTEMSYTLHFSELL